MWGGQWAEQHSARTKSLGSRWNSAIAGRDEVRQGDNNQIKEGLCLGPRVSCAETDERRGFWKTFILPYKGNFLFVFSEGSY